MNSFYISVYKTLLLKLTRLHLFEINLRQFGRIFRPHRNLFVQVKCGFVDFGFGECFVVMLASQNKEVLCDLDQRVR